jgi:hypothetical protein
MSVVAIVVAGLEMQGAETGSVRTVAVPGGGQPVVARCDAQGTIHLVYSSPSGPQYVRSTDSGRTFSEPLAIVDRQAASPGLEFTVWDMAVGPGGRVHVALGTNAWKLKLPKEEWGFYYSRLDPRAKSFAAVANINRHPSEGFSLAADDRGNVTACWLSGKLYAQVSHDHGATFGPAAEIDSSIDPCDCCTTSIAYGEDGRLAVLYREETNDQRDMFLVLWDQSKNQVSRTRVSTTLWKIDACPMTYYSVVPTPPGYEIVWPTEGQVYFARLNSRGELVPPGEIKTPGQSGMRSGLAVLPAKDGQSLVVWKKSGQLGWQLYDAKGQPAFRSQSVKSPGAGVAAVRTLDGEFVLFR